MMDRRSFIGAVGATVLAQRLGAFAADRQLKRIGMQLYTVRTQLEKDFEGTIAKVAEIGYKEVEFFTYYGHDPKEVKAILERHGLTSPSTHVPMKDLRDKLQQTIDAAHIIGHEWIVNPWVDEEDRGSIENWKRIAAFLNQTAMKVQAAGLKFAYHNHDFEFKPTDGRLPYDVLQADTDPKLVQFEMDLYWITRGGQDPLKYFNKFPGRYPLVHVKDMEKPPGHNFTEVGRGRIDFKRIFAQSEKAGIQHYYVEQDETPGSPFDSLKISYDYLKTLKY
ncbi:MAG TPA: sugar phosphate isomerase/epimerase [Terriglobales bacterium]|nr:sugar phosphate isomerase/epimerase [Terriglobales bacterium]